MMKMKDLLGLRRYNFTIEDQDGKGINHYRANGTHLKNDLKRAIFSLSTEARVGDSLTVKIVKVK